MKTMLHFGGNGKLVSKFMIVRRDLFHKIYKSIILSMVIHPLELRHGSNEAQSQNDLSLLSYDYQSQT